MKRYSPAQKEALQLLEIALSLCSERELMLVSVCSGVTTSLRSYHEEDHDEIQDCFNSTESGGASVVVNNLTKKVKDFGVFQGEIVP